MTKSFVIHVRFHSYQTDDVSHPHPTRVSLILRVANKNDAHAWNEFAEIYQPLVFRIALARGLQEADALDLVQEVMTRVAKSIRQWDPNADRGTFRGWISRIARNLVIDFLRHKNRLPQTSDHSDIRRLIDQVPSDSAEATYFDLEIEKQVFLWAAEAIRPKFHENTWNAFWQTAVEHRSVAEVAASLQMTPGSIYIARSRVMSKLKSVVQTKHANTE